MKYKIKSFLVLALFCCNFSQLQAAPIIYADGDVAPLGAPDQLINAADFLLVNRIVIDDFTPTELDLSHADVYPTGAPDGVVNVQDMLLIQKIVLGQNVNNFVENITLFEDGPSTVTVTSGMTSSSTTIVVSGYTGPGATVVNDTGFIDPEDSTNTVWNVSVSGGTGNVYMTTGDLSSDPILDSGFNFSGSLSGQLVFDIKVLSISPSAILTVKIDSGYPSLGQAVLSTSQYTVGSWQRVVLNISDIVADPGPGAGLDLTNVVNAFVIEVTGGDAAFYLDNIFVRNTCPDTDVCHATIKTKPIYTLLWSDEFDGNTLSSDSWSHETGYGSNGWGNDEWQLYTNSANNSSVAGGILTLSAHCASPPNCGKRNGTITSARINTLNKFAFKYGKVEARLKPPVGNGAWPAFWMLGKNFPSVGWPQSGEMDIMEIHNLYSNEYTTHFTMHWCDDNLSSNPCLYNPGWQYISQSKTFVPVSLGDDFHVFSAEWSENGVIGKIDGIPYFNLAINPATMTEFLEEFFMILNIAIGGTLGGAPDVSTPWPQTMEVDYVRVYQDDTGAGTYTIGAPPISSEIGVYSESHIETTLPYSAIVNGADFGGNVLNINQSSTNTVPFDGSVVLQVDYNNTGSSYSGFLFNFTLGRDISPYQTLKFSLNTAAMTNMDTMTVELENPGQLKYAIQIADYTPTVSNGWATYEVPLSDFTGADLTNILYLGYWNPRASNGQLSFGTMYFDDIHFAGGL